VLLVVLSFGALQGPGVQAQGRTVSELRDALQGRYGIVALQRGVALVPRRADGGVRMIEIVDGLVRVDGDTVTGRELNDRLGRDADLILQVSYLSPEAQAQLVEYLFATTDVHRVEASTDVENIAEQRSLEKAGLRREGVVRGAQFRAGGYHDLVTYALLRDDTAD
jgi:hypothetical protein